MLIKTTNQSDESVSEFLGVSCSQKVNNFLFLAKITEFHGTNLPKSCLNIGDNPSIITRLIEAE